MSRIKRLRIDTPQGEAGYLTHEARYVFNYTTSDPSRALSLTMPLRAESYAGTVLPSIFEMNKPEGYLLRSLESQLLKFGKVDDMSILNAIGSNTIGRVTFVNENKEDVVEHASPMSFEEIIQSGNSKAVFEHLLDHYVKSGISGYQPKILAKEHLTAMQPNLIVKTSSEGMPELTANEWVCMTAAQRAGIDVPKFWLSSDMGMFIMQRFDRTKTDTNAQQALGFEDMCVLMGKTPNQKYEGAYKNIPKALSLFCGTNASEGCQKFFDYLVLSILVRNGDAHLKNFGVVYNDPSDKHNPPKLAPLYDVVTTSVYSMRAANDPAHTDRTMALKIDNSRLYPSRDALIRFGRDYCHVNRPGEVIDRVCEAMGETMRDYQSMFSRDMSTRMRKEWDGARLFSDTYDLGHSKPTATHEEYDPALHGEHAGMN